jgi:hypothetical protein
MNLRRASAKAWTRLARPDDARWDLAWAAPLALYRLSGRRLARSQHLYRPEIVRQRRLGLPGMTTPSELAYFKWHAQEGFRGVGHVVDLGCWFGSTTAALAMGLAANPHSAVARVRIHAYDRFAWEPWMDAWSHLARQGPYAEGDTFLPEFETVVAPWRERVEVHRGDLLTQPWEHGGIELLLIDAMKSWRLAEHIVRVFFRALIPDVGHVLHQDYAHRYTPWINLLSYRLRDCLVPVLDVARSETVVFRVVGTPSDVVRDIPLSRESFTDREIDCAFEYSLSITRPDKHSAIRTARVILQIRDGDLAGAHDRVRLLEKKAQVSEDDALLLQKAISEAQNASDGG